MAETVSIGVKLPRNVLDYIEREARREKLDWSAMIRRLMESGIAGFRKDRAAETYAEGRCPLAARRIWRASRYRKWLSTSSAGGTGQAIHLRISDEE